MRSNLALIAAFALAALPLLSIVARSAEFAPAPARQNGAVSVQQPCAAGEYWVEGSYVHGRWRPGHCEKINPNQ
ncbi:MAG TPA: hypothetical protein VMB84_16295 [Stellaceae bacterium]|nr:hypothetical protein [Stellaceae bacterium]